MNFIERKTWDGETCYQCGRQVEHETFVMDDNYFCCEACLGAYLVERCEGEYEMVDFWTKQEILESQREDWYDSYKDQGEW